MGKMNIMFIPKWRLWYKKFNIMNRVIGYVRVSSENQVEKDNSIRNQIKFIKKYCQDYDYELVDIFKDEGVSGLKKSRDGLNKMMKHILIILFLIPLTSYSQKVFSVEYSNQSDGNNGLWYFVDYPNQSNKKIYFVEYSNQSDLKIFFVKYKNQSGWRDKSKQHLMF